jgi:hypothetical protein
MTAPYPTEFERRLRPAYSSHRRNAVRRGTPFLFTFEQWSEWWLTDDRWSRRGRKAGQLQMDAKAIVARQCRVRHQGTQRSASGPHAE